MSSNSITTLAPYSAPWDLVQVRLDATLYPRICTYTREEACARMESIVFGACLYRGQSLEPQVIRLTAKALVSELLADEKYRLRELTWEEIGRAVRLAVLGEGPELYGVNVSSLYGAIVHYVKTEGTEANRKAFELRKLHALKDQQEKGARLSALADGLAGELEQNAKK